MSDTAFNNPPPAAALGIMKAICSRCGGERNCEVHGRYNETFDKGESIYWTNWYILQCRGCDYVFACAIHTNSNDWQYNGDGEADFDETSIYCPALSKRRRPEWMGEWGLIIDGADKLELVLVELYGALDNDLRMLAAIGVRTAYDAAASMLGVDASLTFEKKLQTLREKGHIGVLDFERINTMVEAGSASAHRGWRPQPHELNTIMDVFEHFVGEAIIAPIRRRELDANAAEVAVPKRLPRTKKPKTKSLAPD